MGLKKCPRCELNYILDGGELCTICREEVRGKRSREDSISLCSVCGEYPALPGEDMCKTCLMELRSIEILSTDNEEDQDVETAELDADPVSSLDEIEAVGTPSGDEDPLPLEEDDELLLDDEEADA